MPKIVRSVSLDQQTDLLAQEKSNFSKWVRDQLLSETIYARKCFYPLDTNNVKETNDLGICNGMAKPRCVKCYPIASTTRDQWIAYRASNMTADQFRDHIAFDYEDEPNNIELYAKEEKKEPSTPPMRERKYLRRSLKYIWSFI